MVTLYGVAPWSETLDWNSTTTLSVTRSFVFYDFDPIFDCCCSRQSDTVWGFCWLKILFRTAVWTFWESGNMHAGDVNLQNDLVEVSFSQPSAEQMTHQRCCAGQFLNTYKHNTCNTKLQKGLCTSVEPSYHEKANTRSKIDRLYFMPCALKSTISVNNNTGDS